MQLLISHGKILAAYANDAVVAYDPKAEVPTIILTVDDNLSLMQTTVTERNPITVVPGVPIPPHLVGYKDLKDVLSFDDLKQAYIKASKKYFADVINKEYATYKQMNIIRQAAPYTKEDLDNMGTFIDDKRNKATQVRDKLDAFSEDKIDELIAVNIYE